MSTGGHTVDVQHKGTTQQPAGVQGTALARGTPIGQTGRGVEHGVEYSGVGVSHSGVDDLKAAGQQAINKVAYYKRHWREYPKVITSVLAMMLFLGGALTTNMISSSIGRSYVSSHWDRQTADAHHALDVLLDHQAHPHLYKGMSGESLLSRTRHGLMSLFSMKPTKMTSSRGMMDELGDAGREMYRKATRGPSMYDKAGNLLQDTMYGMKDVGTGISRKIGDVADSVKHAMPGSGIGSGYGSRGVDYEDYIPSSLKQHPMAKKKKTSWLASLFGLGDSHDEDSHMGLGAGVGSWLGSSYDAEYPPEHHAGEGWFGSSGDTEAHDVLMAKEKMYRIAREAERHH